MKKRGKGELGMTPEGIKEEVKDRCRTQAVLKKVVICPERGKITAIACAVNNYYGYCRLSCGALRGR